MVHQIVHQLNIVRGSISDFGNNNATTESIVRVSLDLLITSVYVRKNVLLTNNRFRVITT